MSAPLEYTEFAEDAYLVGQNTSLEGLPFWGKLFVTYILLPLERFVYFMWSWRNAAHVQGVYTSRDAADKEALEYERGYVQQVPVNRSHPSGLVRYGYQNHPLSPAAEKYHRRKFHVAAVNTDLLEETRELVTDLRRKR